ncbi:MAG: STAS domain-containing protein [Spirochaetales bacterium]|nr:STAS domain-containing protein [Spirochaetales bacterium]MBR0520955.1 STAS domain-containing protein [Spirochaetales bacterium]
MLDFNVSDRLTITLKGRIDTSNAASVEADIMKILADNPNLPVTVDCAALEYISSAGLRVIMKTKKAVRDTCLINVAPPVYEIFETTGFTELMDIRKVLRTISVEGCDIIGKGAKGTVYRIDKETIVKTFKDGSDISDIERERKLARTAFVLGIPTAISYDVVKIQGGGYGSVYELLDASNLADELASGRKTMDEVVQLEVDLLKTIHSTEVNPDQIPPFTEKVMKWLEYDKDHIPADKYEKLCSLVQSIPDDNHLIHGDFHMKNIMYQNGECLLIDMDSLSHGNTVYELVTIWCSYVGLGEIDNTIVENFLGIPYQDAVKIWKMTVASFFETDDQAKIKEIEDKVRILGYARIIRRCVRKNRIANETGKKEYENAVSNICSLLDHVDSLVL